MEATNMTQALRARKDKHARAQGDLILRNHVVMIDSAQAVFEFVSKLDSRFFRVLYRCLDGQVRDIIGRQGVYNSRQDGEVQGIGHSMRDAARLNLSFWTGTHGGKVNTGTGKGYRTLRAEGILVLRVKDDNGQDTDIVTGAGLAALQRAALA